MAKLLTMLRSKPIARLLFLIICWPLSLFADQWSGHLKYQASQFWFDRQHVARQLGYIHPNAHSLDARVNYKGGKGAWSYAIHYQLQTLGGDQQELQQDLSANIPSLSFDSTNDHNRLVDVSHDIVSDKNLVLRHRLDRFWLRYSSNHFVVKAGRQAISWGNGMVFQPLDVFAPFAPGSINTDYKTGDDMLYTQWLFDNGSDIEALLIPRRQAGQVEAKWSSLAGKYRGNYQNVNFSLILAEHYDDFILGLSLSRAIGQAQWRFDLLNALADENIVTAMTNLDYSWVWWKKNFYGFIEYYYNQLGQHSIDLNTISPELIARLGRSEVFTYGVHYLAGGLNIELHPLFRFSPTTILNIADGSSQLLLRAQYDWKENLNLNFGINLNLGPGGSEFGGLVLPNLPASPFPAGTKFSTGQWIYMQLSYFF